MIHNIQTVNMDGEKFVNYYSENDFEYSIHVKEKCKIVMGESQIIGTVLNILNDELVLMSDIEGICSIRYSQIDEIYCEEELSNSN